MKNNVLTLHMIKNLKHLLHFKKRLIMFLVIMQKDLKDKKIFSNYLGIYKFILNRIRSKPKTIEDVPVIDR